MIKSRSGKAIVLASGQGLRTLVNLILVAVLARVFSKLDYATYRQTMLVYTFSAPILMLGFERALFYFMPTEKERPRGVLVENLLLLGGGGLVLSLFLTCGGSELLGRQFHNPALAETLRILAPYPLLVLPVAALPACLLALGRAGQVALFSVASRIWLLVVVLVPCLWWPGWPWPSVAITATVLAAGVSAAVGVVLMFRACPASDWRPTLAGLRSQIVFSVPLGLATLAGTINRYLGQVIVAGMCTQGQFAVFVNGAMEIPLVAIITGSVTSVLIVDYTKLHREGRTAEIVALVHRAMVKCALVILPAMVFLLLMAPEVMRLLYGGQYDGSAVPFRVYLLLLPLRTVTFGAILMATGHSRHILAQTVLALVVQTCLSWVAVHFFGPTGAAAAAVLTAYLVSLPYLVVLLSLILNCSIHGLFPWRNLFKVALCAAVPGLVACIPHGLLDLPDSLAILLAAAVYVPILIGAYAIMGLVDWRALWLRVSRILAN